LEHGLSSSRGAPMEDLAPLLAAERLSVFFGADARTVRALDEVDVSVGHGEAVGIVGESGSGKTTLARVFAGLQTITSGVVQVAGARVADSSGKIVLSREQRRSVQMVFQDPYRSLNPRQRAYETVAESLRHWSGVDRSVARHQAFELLRELGLDASVAEQYPRTLSGGQRQRVSIARALAPDPAILIADEPTSALDQGAQAQFLNLIRGLRRKRNLAVLWVSHDLAVVRHVADRVYVLQLGKVVEQGLTERIYRDPEHEYTQTLLAARVPAASWKAHGDLRQRDGDATTVRP
jgi:oligopeptide transport system ATP-binding protein